MTLHNISARKGVPNGRSSANRNHRSFAIKSATQLCPRCRGKEFEIIGEAAIPLAPERGTSWFGIPPEVPVILVSCKTCGYIAHHATAVLGLKR
jgi:predicted nucleic-acid-binding Zn-ribbon protein